MSWHPTVSLRHPVRVATYRAGTVFGPRRLRDHELLWVLSGTAVREVTDPGGRVRRLELLPGNLNLSRPGDTDTYHWDPAGITTHAYVHFDLLEAGPMPPPVQWPEVVSMAGPAVSGLTRYLLDLGADPSPAALARSHDCVALLIDIVVRGPYGGGGEPGRLLPLVELVALRWAEHGVHAVPVADLAASMGVSRGHLAALVSQRHGCGPAGMVELIRLARGALLLQSGHSVTAAAQACGYSDPYHFSRRFRTAYAMPPTRFRGQGVSADPFAPLRRHDLLPVAQRLIQAANPS